jgi:hypothetical protein
VVLGILTRDNGESLCGFWCLGHCGGNRRSGVHRDYEGNGLATMKTLRWLQRANSEEIKKWIPFTVVVDGKPEFVVGRYDGQRREESLPARPDEEAQGV